MSVALPHRQCSIEWHARRVFVDNCIEQLERGEPMITRCPDRLGSYVDCGACRVYFDDGDDLLRYEITLGSCK